MKARAVCRRIPEHCGLLAALLTCLLGSAVSAQAPHPLDAAAGKALFERNWVAAPASTAAADGLGPLYNARSCAECHPGGGASAAPEHLVVRVDDPSYGRQLQTRALAGLQPEARVTAVWAAVDTPRDEQVEPVLSQLQLKVDSLQYGTLQSTWSGRMPPSLHGVGGIAAVHDSTLLALEDPDDANRDGISGRTARVRVAGVEQIGRFGWKAESPDLAHQVANAFSLDLGLGSAAFASPHGDCTARQSACLRGVDGASSGASRFELPALVPELIVLYLQTLKPAHRVPQDLEGLALFSQMGCAACHVPQLEEGLWLFSDLLLHDMGPGLAAELPEAQATASEWRTAPLSALSGKRRFLHDGRARDLQEAIRWHGGEAQQARLAWQALPREARIRLDTFLQQLLLR